MKILHIENLTILNSINMEGGDITSGIYFFHADFAREIDLNLAKNADVTIFCNVFESKMNTTAAC